MRNQIRKSIQRFRLQPFHVYVFSAIFLVLVYLLLRYRLIFAIKNQFPIIHSISDLYAHLLMYGSKFSLWLVGYPTSFDLTYNAIIGRHSPLYINTFFFSLKHIFLLLVVVVVTPSDWLGKLKYFSMWLGFYIIYNILRIDFHLYFNLNILISNPISMSILAVRDMLFVGFIYIFWNRYPSIKDELCRYFSVSSREYRMIYIKAGIMVIIIGVTLLVFFNNLIPFGAAKLSNCTLNLTAKLLEMNGINTEVTGKIMICNNLKIILGANSLGLNVMLVFIAFIVVIPGWWINKLWYIPLGICLLFVLNALRIALAFSNTVHHLGVYSLPVDKHNLFTYPAYLLVVTLWIVWMARFRSPHKS